jgi:hypothetical protein
VTRTVHRGQDIRSSLYAFPLLFCPWRVQHDWGCLTPGCRGEHAHLRGRKWHVTGENFVTRGFFNLYSLNIIWVIVIIKSEIGVACSTCKKRWCMQVECRPWKLKVAFHLKDMDVDGKVSPWVLTSSFGPANEMRALLFSCWPPAYLLVLTEIISSTLKMEAICSSETSVATQQTRRRHIPEDDTFQYYNGFYRNKVWGCRQVSFGSGLGQWRALVSMGGNNMVGCAVLTAVAVLSRRVVRRNVSHPSSGSRNKPSK